MTCVPILGRLKAAAVFQLDDCMRPVYGTGTGYMDDCFAAFSSSDNMDEGTEFTRRCSDGTILYYEPGEQSLQSVEVNLDFNAEPDNAFLASLGMVTPITNGEGPDNVIGFTRCTKGSANLLVVVWQEVLGSEACLDDESDQWRVHLFPLRKARLTLEGDVGAEDSFFRITGVTASTANLGQGPIPLLRGEDDDAIFPTNDMVACHHTVLTSGIAAPPEECGVVDTEEPVEGP